MRRPPDRHRSEAADQDSSCPLVGPSDRPVNSWSCVSRLFDPGDGARRCGTGPSIVPGLRPSRTRPSRRPSSRNGGAVGGRGLGLRPPVPGRHRRPAPGPRAAPGGRGPPADVGGVGPGGLRRPGHRPDHPGTGLRSEGHRLPPPHRPERGHPVLHRLGSQLVEHRHRTVQRRHGPVPGGQRVRQPGRRQHHHRDGAAPHRPAHPPGPAGRAAEPPAPGPCRPGPPGRRSRPGRPGRGRAVGPAGPTDRTAGHRGGRPADGPGPGGLRSRGPGRQSTTARSSTTVTIPASPVRSTPSPTSGSTRAVDRVDRSPIDRIDQWRPVSRTCPTRHSTPS